MSYLRRLGAVGAAGVAAFALKCARGLVEVGSSTGVFGVCVYVRARASLNKCTC